VEGYEGVAALVRGCPPQTPPVCQGRAPETRIGCAGGECVWVGCVMWWDVVGCGGMWWEVVYICYNPALFNLSRMSFMRDC
jgi:hypothetical protein